MIGLDSSILESNSASAGRMKDYGSICDELHIVILGTGGENFKLANRK